MKALFYLLGTRIKNQFKLLLHSPGRLIGVGAMLALLIFMMTGAATGEATEEYRDVSEVYAMAAALYAVIFVMNARNGFNKGASLFSMADVNLVFVSPIKPKRALLYGLIQQLGTALLLGFFLLFQYGWLYNSYGIPVGALVVILLGYAFTVFCAQLVSMALYTLTAGNPRRKRQVKAVFYGVIGAFALYLFIRLYAGRADLLGAGVSALNGPALSAFPVAGWLAAAVRGALTGQLMPLLVGAGATVLLVGGIILYIEKARADFYEDVLQATELAFSAAQASKEGRIGEAAPGAVHVGKSGISRGMGASVFYEKHKIENRRARKFIVNSASLTFILVTVAMAVFMREAGILAVFAFGTYMQMFSVSLGRWVKELTRPFIYLVPEPPFKKLLYCIKESVPRMVAEAVVIFIPVGLILGTGPIEVLFCILARLSFGLLFTAGNILVERCLSGLTLKPLILMAYFLSLLVLSAPGIIAGLLLNMTVAGALGDLPILLGMAAVNTLVGLLVIFLCRNMLTYAELNNR